MEKNSIITAALAEKSQGLVHVAWDFPGTHTSGTEI